MFGGFWQIRRKAALAAVSSILLAMLALPGPTWAMPPVLQPTAVLGSPNWRHVKVESVAIDGDFAVAVFPAYEYDPQEEAYQLDHTAIIYRRNAGVWQPHQTIVSERYLGMRANQAYVALRGNVMAFVSLDRLRVYERIGNGTVWQESPVAFPMLHSDIFDVKLDNGTIVIAVPNCNTGRAEARAFRKNSAGTWAQAGTASSSDAIDCEYSPSATTAISGNTVIVGAPRLADATGAGFYFFQGAPNTWSQPSQAVLADSGQSSVAAVSGNLAIVNGSELYQSSGGAWTFKQHLWPLEQWYPGARAAQIRGNLAVLGQGNTLSVYEGDASLDFTEIARLAVPGGNMRASSIDISGRRVIANNNQDSTATYIYEVPSALTQPDLIQDTFQTGSNSRWTPLAGSWSIATTPATRVYRQASIAADATTLLNNADWTDQSVQPDIRPTAYSGNDRWFGLAVRRSDALNYYYLTARSSNILQLKKMVNGVFQTINTTELSLPVDRNYRLRLEAIGTTIKAYVNGLEVLSTLDASLTHGQAALMTYKTSAEHDNVIFSPSPQATVLYDGDFFDVAEQWTPVAGNWTDWSDPYLYMQTSTAGDARSLTGPTITDQSVQTYARQVGVGTGTQTWFGVLARYRDENNYYYVTLRNSGEISLRRLLNGTTLVLDSAPFSVVPNRWYWLRLEAIQNQSADVRGRRARSGSYRQRHLRGAPGRCDVQVGHTVRRSVDHTAVSDEHSAWSAR